MNRSEAKRFAARQVRRAAKIEKRASRVKVQPGDIAVLRTGGPEMTIESIEGDVLTCRWFGRRDSGGYETQPLRCDFKRAALLVKSFALVVAERRRTARPTTKP